MTVASRVVVVGGGITGLAAAWEATLAGHQVSVMEASDRFGGLIRTSPIELPDGSSLIVDEGADAFLARVPEAVELCRELGLDPDFTEPATGRAMIHTDSGLRWFPADTVLGVPLSLERLAESELLSVEGLAQVASEIGRGDPTPRGDVSIGDLLRARFGDELVDRVVGPLVGGINAGNVDRMSLRAVTPQLADAVGAGGCLTDELRRRAEAVAADAPVFQGLRGGTQQLVDTLVRELRARGADLRTGCPVDSVAIDELPADLVVVTTPATAASRLIEPISPAASAEIATIETASVVLGTLVFDRADFERPALQPEGSGAAGALVASSDVASGFLVPRDAGLLLSAVSWGSTKWPNWNDGRHIVVRASAGHRDDRRVEQMTDDATVAALLEDLHTTTGLRSDAGGGVTPLATRVSRFANGFHQYDVGHLDLVDRIDEHLRHDTEDRVRVAGAAYRGLGIPACIRQGRAAVRPPAR